MSTSERAAHHGLSLGGGVLGRVWALLQTRIGRRRQPAASRQDSDPQHAAMRRALRRALDQHPSSRGMLRHLSIFEKTLRRHGSAAFDKLPSSFLYRVNQQLAGIAADDTLRGLGAEIDRTLAHRMDKAEKEFAFVSSLEFSTQVDVEEIDGEDALREFAMLWRKSGEQDEPQKADDWPITRPPAS